MYLQLYLSRMLSSQFDVFFGYTKPSGCGETDRRPTGHDIASGRTFATWWTGRAAGPQGLTHSHLSFSLYFYLTNACNNVLEGRPLHGSPCDGKW